MFIKISKSNVILFVFIFIINLIYSCTLLANTKSRHAVLLAKKLLALENQFNGRLGVYLYNLNDNHQFGYHANQRFPMCSTAKLFVVADILKMSISNHTLLSKNIYYTRRDLSKAEWAPITKNHLNAGMTIKSLCEAAIEYSDNAAINALLKYIGGPKSVTTFARSIGDYSFQLNRYEPELNTAMPGDTRDTNTPKDMVNSLKKIAFGDVLKAHQKQLLIHWLINNTTGSLTIKKGVPKNWMVGDKTGSGQYGTTNDIAILFPPHKLPIVMAVYFTGHNKNMSVDKSIISQVSYLLTH